MTKKDFQLIADILLETNASLELVRTVAKKLETTNPRFDQDRFILAAMNWE